MQINIIDIIIIALSLLLVVAGYFKGLFLSIVGIMRFVFAVPLSFFVSDNFSQGVYDGFVRSYAVERVGERISSFGSIDEYTNKLSESSSIVSAFIKQGLGSLSLESLTNEKAAAMIVDNLLESALITVIKVCLFVLTMLAFYLITSLIILIIRHFSKKDKTPLKTANRFFGAVFGAVKALMLAVAFSLVAKALLSVDFLSGYKIVKVLDNSLIIDYINNTVSLINYPEV